MHLLALVLSLAGIAHASQLTLDSLQFTISASNATQLRSEPLTPPQKPHPLRLSATDTLKLTFKITLDSPEGQGVKPHQTFLRFYDPETDEEGIQPVRVTAGGKAKFELNMARPPSSLPPTTTAPLQVSLYLGSFVHAPVKFELFDLHVPPSHPAPTHPDEIYYSPLPPIAHTFRPDQKLPPKIISLVFAAIVLLPWLLLLALWANVKISTHYLFSPSIFLFVALLTASEALLIWYWVDLKLGQVLLYGGILAIFTTLAGKQALASIGQRRVGRIRHK